MSGNETTGKSNMQTSPDSIFICYRREDSADVTGRIYDRLVDHFGPERVFIDVEAIRLGYDFAFGDRPDDQGLLNRDCRDR